MPVRSSVRPSVHTFLSFVLFVTSFLQSVILLFDSNLLLYSTRVYVRLAFCKNRSKFSLPNIFFWCFQRYFGWQRIMKNIFFLQNQYGYYLFWRNLRAKPCILLIYYLRRLCNFITGKVWSWTCLAYISENLHQCVGFGCVVLLQIWNSVIGFIADLPYFDEGIFALTNFFLTLFAIFILNSSRKLKRLIRLLPKFDQWHCCICRLVPLYLFASSAIVSKK